MSNDARPSVFQAEILLSNNWCHLFLPIGTKFLMTSCLVKSKDLFIKNRSRTVVTLRFFMNKSLVLVPINFSCRLLLGNFCRKSDRKSK